MLLLVLGCLVGVSTVHLCYRELNLTAGKLQLMNGGYAMKMLGLVKTVKVVGMCLVMAALMYSFAAAQDKPTDADMQILIEKIKADKKLLVAENMQLSEAEAKKFWLIYDEFQNELFILRMRSLKLIESYAENYKSMTNDIAKKLLDEYMTIESLRQKVREAYLPKFRKVLPEIKVARYYQIENKIGALVNYELAKQIPLLKTNQ
jgi:hypothetical protein